MNQEFIENLYQKYGKEKVDEAMAFLLYKKANVELPKCEETGDYPILYVFRHGQSQDNVDFIFSGWRDPDLTEKGIQQALLLAPKLKDKKIDALYASDQKRAIKTMELAISQNVAASKLPIIKDPRIKERSYGVLMGQSKLILQLEDPELLQRERRSYDIPCTNGESIKMVVERVQGFIEELIIKMKTEKINVAVSCHGNSMRGFRKYFEGLTDEETATIESPLAQDYASYIIK